MTSNVSKRKIQKSKFARALTWVALCAAPLAFVGCETSDDQQISSAQSCLDSATDATTADVCTAKIAGNESSEAYLIRCSANFISQGVTGARLATAFQALKDNGDAAQGTATAKMAAYLVFNDTTTAHNATTTLSYCQSSGVASMYKLSQAIALASAIPNLLGTTIDPTLPPAQLAAAYQTAITNLIASGAANEAAVGNIAINAGTTMCTTGSTYASTDVCKTLTAAAAAGDASAVGAQLLNLMKH